MEAQENQGCLRVLGNKLQRNRLKLERKPNKMCP